MKISIETKEAIVKQVLSSGSSLKLIAQENNVGHSSLSKWMMQYRSGLLKKENTSNSKANKWSWSERFEHILSSSSLDEQALGVYCRERGLYSTQLLQWKEGVTGIARKNYIDQAQFVLQ